MAARAVAREGGRGPVGAHARAEGGADANGGATVIGSSAESAVKTPPFPFPVPATSPVTPHPHPQRSESLFNLYLHRRIVKD